MTKKYIVGFTEAERTELKSLAHKGKEAAHKRLHAEILLKADIRDVFGISIRTVARVRKRLVTGSLEVALNRTKLCRTKRCVIDAENEAHLIALIYGDAPEGHS